METRPLHALISWMWLMAPTIKQPRHFSNIPTARQAFVSSAFGAGDRDGKVEDEDFWPVDLLYVNSDADLAVLRRTNSLKAAPNVRSTSEILLQSTTMTTKIQSTKKIPLLSIILVSHRQSTRRSQVKKKGRKQLGVESSMHSNFSLGRSSGPVCWIPHLRRYLSCQYSKCRFWRYIALPSVGRHCCNMIYDPRSGRPSRGRHPFLADMDKL